MALDFISPSRDPAAVPLASLSLSALLYALRLCVETFARLDDLGYMSSAQSRTAASNETSVSPSGAATD